MADHVGAQAPAARPRDDPLVDQLPDLGIAIGGQEQAAHVAPLVPDNVPSGRIELARRLIALQHVFHVTQSVEARAIERPAIRFFDDAHQPRMIGPGIRLEAEPRRGGLGRKISRFADQIEQLAKRLKTSGLQQPGIVAAVVVELNLDDGRPVVSQVVDRPAEKPLGGSGREGRLIDQARRPDRPGPAREVIGQDAADRLSRAPGDKLAVARPVLHESAAGRIAALRRFTGAEQAHGQPPLLLGVGRLDSKDVGIARGHRPRLERKTTNDATRRHSSVGSCQSSVVSCL